MMQTMIPSQATEIKDVHQQTVQSAQPLAQGGQMAQGQPMVFQPMMYQVRMSKFIIQRCTVLWWIIRTRVIERVVK